VLQPARIRLLVSGAINSPVPGDHLNLETYLFHFTTEPACALLSPLALPFFCFLRCALVFFELLLFFLQIISRTSDLELRASPAEFQKPASARCCADS